jgi:UDP-N-acetyl-D-glucosamine dehydrogenase
MELLADRGAVLSYHDPFVPDLPELGLRSAGLDGSASADAVVLVTAHPGVDHAALAAASQLFIDLRGTTWHTRASGVLQL